MNTSLEKLSLNLDESDKSPLSDYLTYKCLVKFRGINETNLLYEGCQRYGDDLTELSNERNAQRLRSKSIHPVKPSDDDYRTRYTIRLY